MRKSFDYLGDTEVNAILAEDERKKRRRNTAWMVFCAVMVLAFIVLAFVGLVMNLGQSDDNGSDTPAQDSASAGNTEPESPGGNDSTVNPSEEKQDPAQAEIAATFSSITEAENISVDTAASKTTISIADPDMGDALSAALDNGTAPNGWTELQQEIIDIAAQIEPLDGTEGICVYLRGADGVRILLTVADGRVAYDAFSMQASTDGSSILGQNEALEQAESYLDHMAFSRQGLIEQLQYEGYTLEEAVYAVDHCGADWNEQAAQKAASYLEHSSFSRQGLIDQLMYEGFTSSEAEYGVQAVGY